MWPTIHLVRRVDIVMELLSKIKMSMELLEVLNISVGERAAKIQAVKVGGLIKFAVTTSSS